jgi:hypothetical protein
MIDRRSILALVAAAVFTGGASLSALADKGSGKGGDSGGDGDGGSGSGSGDSGGGGDDGGDDHGDGDDGDNSGPGSQDDDRDDDRDEDGRRQARNARQRGKASALRDVLGLVKRRYHGRVVGVKFASRRESSTYQIKLIDDSGRLLTVSVDALTRRILEVSGP